MKKLEEVDKKLLQICPPRAPSEKKELFVLTEADGSALRLDAAGLPIAVPEGFGGSKKALAPAAIAPS